MIMSKDDEVKGCRIYAFVTSFKLSLLTQLVLLSSLIRIEDGGITITSNGSRCGLTFVKGFFNS